MFREGMYRNVEVVREGEGAMKGGQGCIAVRVRQRCGMRECVQRGWTDGMRMHRVRVRMLAVGGLSLQDPPSLPPL